MISNGHIATSVRGAFTRMIVPHASARGLIALSSIPLKNWKQQATGRQKNTDAINKAFANHEEDTMNTLDPYDARSLATQYAINLEKDFFTLSFHEVAQVILAADTRRYRKPRQANGSRGRYFFAYLQRAARRSNHEEN